jgi:raffinose/stachyose/melibiose transport system permease protein
MRQNPVAVWAKQIVAVVLCVIVIVPFLLIILNSFKTEGEAALMNMRLPSELILENYTTVIERGKLVRSFLNSTYYSTFTVLLTVAVTSMASFVLARRRTRLNQFFYFFLILGIVLPINFVALIKVMQVLQLINTRIGMVLLYAAAGSSFAVFITTGFVGSVPKELDEAAIIDGAGPWNLFLRVIFPLLKPVLVTVMVLQFLGTWNDFITPLYMLNRSSMWPMTLAVYNFFGRYESSWNLVFADIVLTILPVFGIYLLGQRHIVSGMTSGALKG